MPPTITGGKSAPGAQQGANSLFAGPGSGADDYPAFRPQVIADLPNSIPNSKLLNSGNNDLLALQLLGSSVKAATINNVLMAANGGSGAIIQGQAHYTAIYLPVGATLTGVKFILLISGVYVATGYNGFALYTVNLGTGLLTQVAASTSSATVWAGSLGMISVPFSAPFVAAAGIYFIAYLPQWSSVTTAPTIHNITINGNAVSYDFANGIKVNSGINGQTTLSATQLSSALGVSGLLPALYLY